MNEIAAAGLLLALSMGTAFAQEGTLTITDGVKSVTLDMAQIEAMEQQTIETTTPWTEGEGVQVFAGPAVSDVLDEAGFAGESVAAEALDGYGVVIPRERLSEDGALLAVTMNGAPLPEDKAPYWIVFPYDQSPEMNDKDHQDWSIWAVTKLMLE